MRKIYLKIFTVCESHRKVSFSIASLDFEWAKSIKSAKNIQFGRVFENLKLRANSVTRQVSFNRTKVGGKCQKFKNSNATFFFSFLRKCKNTSATP